jgi:predicted permease
MSWVRRLSNLWRHDQLSAELDEELQFHLEARIRDNLAAGMAAEAARLDARRRFGNLTLAKERTREVNVLTALETMGQDLHYAWRGLRRSPAFAVIAISAVALGIGANTAVFTVVNGVLLRPLPLPHPERLCLISYRTQHGPLGGEPGLSDRHFLEFERRNRAFEHVATFNQDAVTLTGAGEARRVRAALVTSSFFVVLRTSPAIGRAFTPAEEPAGADRVVLLSDRLWRSRFGADPHILGKTITLDGIGRTVMGIMPAGFGFPQDVELWLPLAVGEDPRNTFFRPAIGRLRTSWSRKQAEEELTSLAGQLPIEGGEKRSDMRAEILPLNDLVVGKIRKALLVFMGSVAFVLLIACANVANLLLMRAASRRQEIAVRATLGARRGRLIRQLLTESTLVSLAGAVIGILIAVVGVPALLALAPPGSVPRAEGIRIDAWVLAFAVGLGVSTGALFGLVPAFQSAGRGLYSALSQGGRTATGRRERLRSGLVVAEIALALVLLAGAGLMLKSFLRMRAVKTGFRAANILTLTIDLPDSSYPTTVAVQAFHARTLAKLANLPGVQAAGAVNWLPLGPALMRGDFHLDGGQRMPPGFVVDKSAVSAEYLRVMGIQLLNGRGFSEQDDGSAPPVVIISRSVARALWPGDDAVGRRISWEDQPGPHDWLTIVGVADDVRQQRLTDQPDAAIYQPYQQVKIPFFLRHMTFVVRVPGNGRGVAAAMRRALQEVDSNEPVESIATMKDLIASKTAEPWFQARLISIFSLLALLLAAIGIYGVLAQAVTERRREIGIRMTLGAAPGDITSLVLKRSLLLAAAGVTIGLAGALAATRVLARFLFEVQPMDPVTLLSVAALLAAVAILAGLLPARRAASVDPLEVLRSQ